MTNGGGNNNTTGHTVVPIVKVVNNNIAGDTAVVSLDTSTCPLDTGLSIPEANTGGKTRWAIGGGQAQQTKMG